MDNQPTNVIVNFLPRDLNDDDFKRMFYSFGEVNSCKIVREAKSGHSYGFGFCDYVHHEDALRAIKTYDGLHLKDRNIKVAFAKDGEKIKEAKLYVEDIPLAMNEEELRKVFEPFGIIINCRFLKDSKPGPKKTAFVQYESKEEAEQAMESVNDEKLESHGCSLKVSHADNKTYHFKSNDRSRIQKSPLNGLAPSNRNNMNMFNPGLMDDPFAGNRYGIASMNDSSNSTLFLYNIGSETPEDAVWKLMAPFGAIVKIDMIFDKETKVGKGFCFVTMRNHEDCIEAIRKLNGVIHEINPKNALQVRFKKEDKGSDMPNNSFNMFDGYVRYPTEIYGFPSNGMQRNLPMPTQRPLGFPNLMQNMNTGMNNDGYVLFVYNIGADATENDLLKIFAVFGAVLKVDVIMNKETKKGKGFGFVTMKNYNDAKIAINQLDGAKHSSLNSGKPLQVRFKDDDGKNNSMSDGILGGSYNPYTEMSMPAAGRSVPPGLMDPYMNDFDSFSRDVDYGLAGPIRNGRSSMKNRFNPMSTREIPSMADMTISDGHVIFIYNISPKADESFLYKLFAPFGAVNKVDIMKHQETGNGKGYGFVTMKHYDEAVESIKKLNGLCHESNPDKPLQVKFKASKK